MEQNTYTLSTFIGVPTGQAAAYQASGDSLTEYTLFSRMQERIDDSTWLGTASGYQAGLYYHVRRKLFNDVEIVEWHCGPQLGVYFHVYLMLFFDPKYFEPESTEQGSYLEWISFVDPARRNPMITQGTAIVHRSEARSMKAQLERRAGIQRAVHGQLELKSHTIYIDAPPSVVADYLSDVNSGTEWSYMQYRDGSNWRDEYGHPIEVSLRRHDLSSYSVIEHDTRHSDGRIVRAPMLIIPAAYAFAQPDARGVILHRVTAWPATGTRQFGKLISEDYDTEAINTKRRLEAKAGNLATYARGCSYGS